MLHTGNPSEITGGSSKQTFCIFRPGLPLSLRDGLASVDCVPDAGFAIYFQRFAIKLWEKSGNFRTDMTKMMGTALFEIRFD
jgi:hypothetical protein